MLLQHQVGARDVGFLHTAQVSINDLEVAAGPPVFRVERSNNARPLVKVQASSVTDPKVISPLGLAHHLKPCV